MNINNHQRKLYFRIDLSGRVVAGSGQWRKSKPKNGRWILAAGEACCTSTSTTSTTSSTTTTTTTN